MELCEKSEKALKAFEITCFPVYHFVDVEDHRLFNERFPVEFNLVLFAFRFLILSIREKRVDVTFNYIVTRDKTQGALYIKSCPLMELFDYVGEEGKRGGGRALWIFSI